MPELEILINKFWSGTISHDELKQLEKLLQQQQSGDSVPALVVQPGNENVQHTFGQEKADELLKKIYTNIPDAGSAGYSKALKRNQATFLLRLSGIAASITLAIIFTWSWMRKDEAGQLKNSIQQASITALTYTENKTDTIMNISLPDGSAVRLYPGSEISYYRPFINNKRDITLKGAAEFKVTGDRLKPFTVYANGIATTALGTRFKVDVEKKQVYVLLYEGRVMIQPASGGARKAYLNPGQQLCVAKDFDYIISEIQPVTRLAAVTKVTKALHKEDQLSANTDTINMSFRNTPLSDVFDKLAEKYHIHIDYTDKEKLQQISFTGHFNANDSLENLLKVLCGMNNLQYELAGDKVNISNP